MERAIPILPVDNLYLAKLFYVDALGFHVVFETSDDDVSGIMGIARGTIGLTLECPMKGHGRHVCVALEVDSTDFYYEEWRHKVKINRAPQNETWNARTFDLSDPFGNTIFVIGPTASQPQVP
ncbi:MAG: glyoxalase superfamily protein [Pseudomonadota bacterium]